jgi:hypothetical protein
MSAGETKGVTHVILHMSLTKVAERQSSDRKRSNCASEVPKDRIFFRINPKIEIVARAHSDAEVEHLTALGADIAIM